MFSFAKSGADVSKPDEIMESTTDAAEWKLEVERVLPQLKYTIRSDNKVSRINCSTMYCKYKAILNRIGEFTWSKCTHIRRELKKA